MESYNERVLSINEVLVEYPCFTKWSLRKARLEQNLPYFTLGKRIFFLDDHIKKWLYNKIVYNITELGGEQNA